jgi:hypothetical protein
VWLSPSRRPWGCDTKNNFLLGAAVTIPSKTAVGMQHKNQFLLGAAVTIPSRTALECDTQKSIVDLVRLSPFHPGSQWECDTQNQFLLGAAALSQQLILGVAFPQPSWME